jgi:aspartyl-tRNA(Asn)/glutamyl-tRNA(Gln) amidotransferase subunit B
MRSKEDAQDYRYFPDPDLLPLAIAPQWIEDIRRSMPALPAKLRKRYREEYALSVYDSNLLTESREKAEFFDHTVGSLAGAGQHVSAAHWINGEVSALVNERNADFAKPPVSAKQVARLLDRIHDGTVSAKAAKEVLHSMMDGEADADAIIATRGLRQISDAGALESAVEQALAAQPKLVVDYRAGKEKAFNALVGQVMKATGGKANPAQVSEILRKRLKT